ERWRPGATRTRPCGRRMGISGLLPDRRWSLRARPAFHRPGAPAECQVRLLRWPAAGRAGNAARYRGTSCRGVARGGPLGDVSRRALGGPDEKAGRAGTGPPGANIRYRCPPPVPVYTPREMWTNEPALTDDPSDGYWIQTRPASNGSAT